MSTTVKKVSSRFAELRRMPLAWRMRDRLWTLLPSAWRTRSPLRGHLVVRDSCYKAEALDGRPLSPSEAHGMLGFIVCQAMYDGMTAVAIGIDHAIDSEWRPAWMKYYGIGDHARRYFESDPSSGAPLDQLVEEPIWWDMVPPSEEAYPSLLQAVISLTRLEGTLPPRGQIPAVFHGREFMLDCEVPDLSRFTLSGFERYFDED